MRPKLFGLLVTGTFLFLLVAPARAHHGGAAYDSSNMKTLTGTVTDFQFIQPHPLIFLDVKDASGNIEKWYVEMTAPNHLSRYGWTGHKLHAGQVIKVMGNPARNGNKVLNLRKIFDGDGNEIPLGPPPRPEEN